MTEPRAIKKQAKRKEVDAAAEAVFAAELARDGEALAASVAEAANSHSDAVQACCRVTDDAFKMQRYDMAFAIIRAGLHKHGLSNDKLCKRYFFMLDTIVKARVGKKKADAPPKMLYLRELSGAVPPVLYKQLEILGGADGVKAGERCVLFKERGVMVIGLSYIEWRVLVEKPNGPKIEMQIISGVEEAVVRGLSQSDGMSESAVELKMSWNSWALKLCEAEDGAVVIRARCLLQRTVLLLGQNSFEKAIDSANEVLKIQPSNKHAAALLATAMHKLGRKKDTAAIVTDICSAFAAVEDVIAAQDDLGQPLELVVSLLVEMHRTMEALKLLSTLLTRVAGPRHQPIFFGLARLYAKHGLNKDALVLKLPTLCCRPPDRRTWDLLKCMAEYTPVAVEQQLQMFIDETGPGRFSHVPMITEVMCKLPFGAHGSAANKALQLLKQCATQVSPERPEDLKIIVEDLRAFMSSNIPAQVSEQFPKTIESLLISYMKALTAEHTLEAWEMPGEMMKRAFSGGPPSALLQHLQQSCMRLPPTSERLFWPVFRHMQSEGVALLRAWLLQHDDPDVERMERCAKYLYQQKGEHAAALDLLRWAEARNLRVCQDAPMWRLLYFKVLRATADERATIKPLGALSNGGLDMSTPMLHDQGGSQALETTSFRHYRSMLTNSEIPLRLITILEKSVMAEYSEIPAGADGGDVLDIEAGTLLADAPAFSEAVQDKRRSDLTERTHQHLDLNGAQLLPGELLQQARNGTQSDSLSPTETTPLLDREGSAIQELPLGSNELAHAESSIFSPPQRVIGNQMFSAQQLEFAVTTLDALGLKQYVPERIADEEAWSSFVHNVFTGFGWHLMAQQYAQPDRALLRQQLFGDMERLQDVSRERAARGGGEQAAAPSQVDEVPSEGHRLERLSAILQDHRERCLDGKLCVESMETAEAVDSLLFEIGQRHVWQERFGGAMGAGPQWHSFVHAPANVQASFKFAFLQAANQLRSPNGRPRELHTSMDAIDNWPMAALHANEETQACIKMLLSDPSGALSMATELLERAAPGDPELHSGGLQLVCGDACFALKQYSNSIGHLQHWAVSGGRASAHGLPNDAVLELVCCMLHENYPTEQVVRVAEDGCSHDGTHAEGWVLLVRLLTELPDADNTQEQAGEEENQNVVNKLLMLLGSNVTNKRERDARMQRCLQEGAEGQAEVPAPTTGRKVTRRHRAGSDESSVHTEALEEFWKTLSPDQRPTLCRVSVAELNELVVQLLTSSLNAEREGSSREGGAKPAADGESGAMSLAETLPMQLLALFTEAARADGEATAEARPGFSWSDALCDIRSLAESTNASRTNVSDLLELSAHGLFWLNEDCVTLGVATTTRALEDGTSARGESEVLLDETLNHALVSSLGPNASSHAKSLDRLLAVEAGFDLDAAAKDMPPLGLGVHITFEQMKVLVRAVAALHRQVGSSLPHAKDALCELCRRLLRKKPVRALLASQRAVLAVLARAMLRSVRAASGERQQELKKEEAARAERELLKTLAEEEAEELKRRETEEADATRRRAKKKEAEAAKKKKVKEKRSTAAPEDTSAHGHGEKAADGDTTSEQAAPHLDGTTDASANAQRRAWRPFDDGAGSLELEDLDMSEEDDNATREAREAAEALAVVEAEEEAQRAWEASLLAPPSPETWEVAKAGRRRAAKGGGAETDAADPTPEEPKARRVGRNPQGTDSASAAGVSPGEEEAGRDGSNNRPRRRKNKARVQGQGPSATGGEGSSDEAAATAEPIDGSGALSRSSQPSATGDDGVRGASHGASGASKRLASGPSSSDLEYAADEADIDGTGSSGGGGTDSATGRRGRRGGKPREVLLPKDGPEGSELAVPGANSGMINGVSTAGAGVGVAGNGRRKNRQAASVGATEDESVNIDAAAAPGLENKTGQHSCFVNVVVQTVWNVEIFREEFQRSKPRKGASEEDSSIFLAMAEVCSMMEDASSMDASQSRAAPKATASALKEALFRLDSNFELGEMHDATEAHEALLEALHRAVEETEEGEAAAGVVAARSAPHTVNGRTSTTGASTEWNGVGHGGRGGEVARRETRSSGEAVRSSGDSFVKRTFAMRMRMEYSKPADPQEEQCKPFLFDQWTQYIVASELRDAVREARAGALMSSPLVTVLRKEAGLESAPDGRAAAPSRKLMLEAPRVFTLGLASDTAHASKGEISESLDGIQERLNLAEVYDALGAHGSCKLLALTAFYESHYVCFCYSQAAGQWIHYDDDTRRLVGRDFEAVREKCIAGRLHPQLLFYCLE